MKCPECRRELKTRMIRGSVELDSCPRCKGIWVDDGELAALAVGKLAARFVARVVRECDTDDGRTCPRCDATMSLCRTDDLDVLLEGCPACAGLWFEKGDLKRMLELLATRFTPTTRAAYDRTVRQLAFAPLAAAIVLVPSVVVTLLPMFLSAWGTITSTALVVLGVVGAGTGAYLWWLSETLKALPPRCPGCAREFDDWRMETRDDGDDGEVTVPVCPYCSADAPHHEGRRFAWSIAVIPLVCLAIWYGVL